MKSIKVTNTGGPEVLKLEDISLEEPGADEVQIEHVSIGLNYIDTYHRSGLYSSSVTNWYWNGSSRHN